MNWRTATRVAAFLLAALDFFVIMAPSLVLSITARQGGLPNTHGLDLLVASLIIATVDSKIVFDRLRDEVKHAGRLPDVWISEFDSLVVLALGTNLGLLFVLGGFAEQHAAIINEGWPILGLWVSVQVFAVLMSELTGRLVFRFLEPGVDLDAPVTESEDGEHPEPPTGDDRTPAMALSPAQPLGDSGASPAIDGADPIHSDGGARTASAAGRPGQGRRNGASESESSLG